MCFCSSPFVIHDSNVVKIHETRNMSSVSHQDSFTWRPSTISVQLSTGVANLALCSAQSLPPPSWIPRLYFWNHWACGLNETPPQVHPSEGFVFSWAVKEGLRGAALLEEVSLGASIGFSKALLCTGTSEYKALSNCSSTVPSCLASRHNGPTLKNCKPAPIKWFLF